MSAVAHALLHLVVQYCNDPRPERQAEFDECVRRNLENPWVAKLHNLVEPHTIVPDWIRAHSKYIEKQTPAWLTYRAAFDYANTTLLGRCAALMNLDIAVDPTSNWAATMQILTGNVVLCLSRHELNVDGSTSVDPGMANLYASCNSQDAWIFRPPVSVRNCDFELGILGCDNAIAERFKRSGYMPINAPSHFRILHIDRVRNKTLSNQSDIHAADRARRPAAKHPEQEGQYLLPDIAAYRSLDQLAELMKLTELERYAVVCDMVSRFVKVKN